MQKRSDDRLIAYLDGEVDASERRGIEAWLDSDPAARDRLAALAQSAALVRSAFDEFMHEPLPDRLIAAATGEAPGALRRRLLLERSAYQLRHGDVPVLQVALAAGYGSAEAFTHAFSRAFGMSPTRHRNVAGPSELPAPNGIHFHPPGGLRLPALAAARFS